MEIPPQLLHILLADDDNEEQLIFQETLGELSSKIKLSFVTNGDDLMSTLNDTSLKLPDIIFLDLSLHSGNNNDCMSEIRMSERLKNIPVVVFTNSLNKKDSDLYYEKGANLFMRKQFNFNNQKIILKKIFSLNWENHQPFSDQSKFIINLSNLDEF
ncbi:MAG: response regulator [Bacteroidia bacterium]